MLSVVTTLALLITGIVQLTLVAVLVFVTRASVMGRKDVDRTERAPDRVDAVGVSIWLAPVGRSAVSVRAHAAIYTMKPAPAPASRS